MHLSKSISTFLCLISLSQYLSSGELGDLTNLKNTASKDLITLKSSGIGHKHPEIIAKEQEIHKLQIKIENLRSSSQQVVVMLKGTSSFYLKGHAKFNKSETALPELLLNNWRIESMMSVGDEKAYVWLTRE